MASYDASINVRVSGTSMVEGVINRVQELERLVRDINTRPINLARPFGRGDMADRFSEAARELNGLKNSFINSERAVQDFGTTSGRTVANTTQLARAFKQIADNSDIASAQFREFTVATQQAAVAANSLGRARLATLANELSFGGRQGRTIGGGTLVQELLAQRVQIPNSISALEAYQSELIDLQRIVRATSPEFRQLEQAVYQLDVALGRAGQFGPAAPPVQGPALPPNSVPPRPGNGGARGGPPPGGLGFNPNPSQENLALGAGFPLLFGGGFGQVAGGLIGSMFGEGFGGQILGSALGQQLEDAITKTTALDTALDLLDADKLRDSIVRVTGELEYQIEVLKKAGRADEARALAAAEVYKVTGLSAETIDNVANKTLRLQQSWEGLVGSGRGLITAISGLSSLIPGLTAILDLTATVVRGWTQLLSLTLDVGTGLRGWFQNLVFGAGTADKVKEKFGGINEETEKIKAQLKSAVDQQLLSAQLGKKLLDIEKQRTIDATIQGKLKDIDLDKQAKITQIESTTATKRSEALLKYAGLKDAASQKELAALLKLIEAEGKQGTETAKLVAARERLVAINANLVEQDKVRIALLQMQGEIAQASESASQNVRAAQIQELEQRKQVALTLGAELSTVKSIYAQKKQGIDAAYAATQREAALKVQITGDELASVEAQKARGQATAEQVAQARNVYNTAVAVTQETLRGAAAVSQAAMSAANLEQRQQTVAAYTAQFASEAGRATNALNEAAAASANQVSYAQALYQAQTTINNVNIQSLQTTLATTRNLDTRALIIDKIKKLEIDNARLAYLSTVAQLQAQVESLRIAYKQVQVKYLELQAVVAIAKAQGLLNRGYIDALDAQRSALRIAAGNLATGKEIARVGGQAATAVYNGAVSAAKLRASTALAAKDAGSFAGSMDRAATSMQRATGVNLQGFSGLEPWMEAKILQAKQGAIMGSTGSSFDSYIAGVTAELAMRAKFEKILSAQRTTANTQAEQDFWTQASSAGFAKFAAGGYVTGPTMGLVGEGGQSEYIIPSSKMAVASANYLAGGRGAGIMEGGSGGGSAPSINITTGPVIEFNGERYVTMRDMERGLQQMATNIYTGLRTPAGRYAVGTR